MIGLWMAYAVLVALLLGGAAAFLERVLRLRSRSARGVWVAALAGSWGLPLMMWLRAREAVPPAPAPAPDAASGVDPTLLLHLLDGAAALPATPLLWLEPLSEVLLAGWVALAVGGISLFGLAVWAVARRSRRWPRRTVLGESVRVSPGFGPAVVGLRRPEIVLPRWVMELGLTGRHLVLRHEREHRDARDTLLLAAGTVATLAAPWNPALWWQLRRLRLAVEVDCDARVLRTGVSPRRYGDLLLSVGERMGRSVVPKAALAEPPSFLERRMRMIAERKRNGSTWTVVAGFVAAAGLVVAACETPAPTVADDGDGDEAVGVFQAVEWEADAPRVIEEQAAGEGSTIRLRGVTSIGRQGTGALAEPLVYIDGVRVSDATVEDGAPGRTPLSSVRPGDIDRIEVVKGEAARAIYGEEAAAGIIQIFTKPGEETGTARLRERREPSDREAAGLSGKILDATERGLHGALRLIGRPADSPIPVAGSIDAVPDKALIVVDGVVSSRAKLETVDRNRIDRIEIVKGGAAARLYGERGANGVIQVYLKKR